jgi:hypothetical protein
MPCGDSGRRGNRTLAQVEMVNFGQVTIKPKINRATHQNEGPEFDWCISEVTPCVTAPLLLE